MQNLFHELVRLVTSTTQLHWLHVSFSHSYYSFFQSSSCQFNNKVTNLCQVRLILVQLLYSSFDQQTLVVSSETVQ